jgi:hypothetical protein
MGNEVAIIDRQQPAVPAFSMSEMERIATAIARGGLFGSKDPNAVLTLCMLAQAEGQHPAVVFRDYDLIQGKPAKKAEAMLRDFMGSGGKVTWNRLDDECADATFSHPQGGTVTINWTMARAQKAQLGGKDMWKKYPRQMLRSRVVSEGVRTVCPTATSGLYVPEEVRDFSPDATPSDTPATPQPKRARDLTQIEAKPDPRAKAEEWVEEFIGKLAEADVEETDHLFAKAASAIAKLEREHPDLHAKVTQFKPYPEQDAQPVDDDAFAETGPHPATPKAEAIIGEVRAANAIVDLNSIASNYKADIAAMPEDLAELVNNAIAGRKREITAEREKAKAGEPVE